jgi:two-component system NtrC family sensor kinase
LEENRFKRIRGIILRRVLLVPFITIMLVCGTLVYYFATDLSEHVASELVRIADGHRNLIEQFLKDRTYDLSFIASSFSIEELKQEKFLSEMFIRLQKNSPAFFDIGVFDHEGNHVAYIGPYDLKGKNYSQAEWFKAVQEKSVYISDVFLGYRNIPHFVIVVRQKENNRPWYLRATIDTLFFTDLVESIRVGKTGEAYLVNPEGLFQTRRRSGGALMEKDKDFGLYQTDQKAIISFSTADYAGDRHLYATGMLLDTGWLLVVRQAFWDAYAPLARAVMIATAIILIGSAIVIVMAYLLASGLANRLSLADMEKRQLGSQLIMAGKLAEVGEMSAGVAHEINNPLQVMKSEQTMINDILFEIEKEKDASNEENFRLLRDSVDQISVQIDRCKRITQGLLKFSRASETAFKAIEIPPFIKEVVAMIETRAATEGVRIVQQFDLDLPLLESDPAQLQQVLLNLLNNALYAVQDVRHGEIKVTVIHENNDLMMSVADNGSGIPPENMEKIFMPFFTSKPVGQGTGLGLSTAYGIIERLGGKITVSSELNVGTVFTVQMPLSGSRDTAGVNKT